MSPRAKIKSNQPDVVLEAMRNHLKYVETHPHKAPKGKKATYAEKLIDECYERERESCIARIDARLASHHAVKAG